MREPCLGAPVTVTQFAARAGDHNNAAMAASGVLAQVLHDRLPGSDPAVVIGQPEPATSLGWQPELEAARADLAAMVAHLDQVLDRGHVPVTALSRCAVALATLPVLAARHPDAVVVWFDAHADLNTPDTSPTGYLGGLALSGPLGLWNSGLGAGLAPENAILVGARDIDPPEQAYLERSTAAHLPDSPTLADDLRQLVNGRPVYLHLDCDVLEPGIVNTDYRVPHGLTLDQLHACATVLAEGPIVGLEISELEADPDPETTRQHANIVADAIEPVLRRLSSASTSGR